MKCFFGSWLALFNDLNFHAVCMRLFNVPESFCRQAPGHPITAKEPIKIIPFCAEFNTRS